MDPLWRNPALLRHRTFEAHREKTSLEMGPRGGVVTQRSANRRRVHSAHPVRNSGSPKSFRHFRDLRFEVGVALIRYRRHFVAVTVAALPGVA
jgi:hypothetical protein